MAEFLEMIKTKRRICDMCEECSGCVLDGHCFDVFGDMEEYEHIVTQWAKEHPIKTNADKFREVFGEEIYKDYQYGCAGFECRRDSCDGCRYYGFWGREYVEPKGEEQ